MEIGNVDAKQRLTVVLKLWDHDSNGPSAVFAQSIDAIERPISPPPDRKSAAAVVAMGSGEDVLAMAGTRKETALSEFGRYRCIDGRGSILSACRIA